MISDPYADAAAERGVELPPYRPGVPATVGPVCDLAEVQGYCAHEFCMTICDEWPGSDEGHECPVQQFLDDPITQAYGLGGDMDEWGRIIRCPVCEAREAE